jgi:hypothetical protein
MAVLCKGYHTVTHIHKPWHWGQPLANQHLQWLPTDSKESFDRMMQDPTHREYFQSLGWDQPNTISYKITSDGFRSDEFDSSPCIMALGCSYTVGIGLPVECTWPALLGQKLGLKVCNLAWGGYALDSCFRLAQYWISHLNTQLVCILLPPVDRVELMLDKVDQQTNQVLNQVFMPHDLSNAYDSANAYLTNWFMQPQNGQINKAKNVLALRQLCADHAVPFCIVDSQTTMTRSREDIGYARDHLHGGPKIHREIADEMYRQYEKNKVIV